MIQLELVINEDMSTLGHLFCNECFTELKVVLAWSEIYKNPNYHESWEQVWHEYYPVRYIAPSIIMNFHDGFFEFRCPQCRNNKKGGLEVIAGGMMDLGLLHSSLGSTEEGFRCIKCIAWFASKKMGAKIQDDYICGDCAAFA